MKTKLLLLVLLLSACTPAVIKGTAKDEARRPVRIERCPEDVVLVGGGNYANGMWDFYACGPAKDNYIP